jgi:hypothetical protein
VAGVGGQVRVQRGQEYLAARRLGRAAAVGGL